MKSTFALATALLALPTASALADTVAERGETRLAQMLGDRLAGAPVQCFEVREGTNAIVIDGVAVAYDLGAVIYVGRPVNAIDPRDTILGQERGGRWRASASPVCATQGFYTFSRRTGMRTGIADIREFVPYTRS